MDNVTFDGRPLFQNALIRVEPGPVGQLVVEATSVEPLDAKRRTIATLPSSVIVRGRFVASTLNAVLEDIKGVEGLVAFPPKLGRLTDGLGRSWPDVALERFECETPMFGGRLFSAAFVARFGQLEPDPAPPDPINPSA